MRLFLLLFFFTVACSHIQEQSTVYNEKQKDKILQTLRDNITHHDFLSANGSISVVNKGKSSSAGAVFIVENPYDLRMEVQDPLGTVHAMLILNQDAFWWLDSHKAKAWMGSPSKVHLPLPLSAEDFIAIMLARPEVNDNIIAMEKNTVNFRSRSNRPEKVQWNNDFEPEEWEFLLDAQRTVRVHYPEYINNNGKRYPAVIIAEIFANNQLEYKFSWRPREFASFLRDKNLFQIPPNSVSPEIKVIHER